MPNERLALKVTEGKVIDRDDHPIYSVVHLETMDGISIELCRDLLPDGVRDNDDLAVIVLRCNKEKAE